MADDQGFLSLDALVALTATALGLVIVLQAYGAAQILNQRASELRAAAALATWALQVQWPRLSRPGDLSGETPQGRSWRIHAERMQGGGEGWLCAIRIETKGRGRVAYRLETFDFCGRRR